jgi:hypothetical protein
MRRRIGRITKLVTLALVLGVVALTIPDSAVKSTEFTLVKVHDAQAAAIGPRDLILAAVDARPARHDPQPRRRSPAGDDQHPDARHQHHQRPRDSRVDIPGHGNERSTPPSTSAARSCWGRLGG